VNAQADGPRPTLELERLLRKRGHRLIAGVDEVGRGSWAGPLVAAAVILPPDCPSAIRALRGVRDSKQLTAAEREALFDVIFRRSLAVGIGWASHHFVDRAGISEANRRAMIRAVCALRITPQALVIDHLRLPDCPLPQLCISRGDSRSLSVAAASVVAKVFRDRWMTKCDTRFPGYRFAEHKGYGTHSHRAALTQHGPSPVHRRSFRPIALLTT
jgi:ribonuclease HII